MECGESLSPIPSPSLAPTHIMGGTHKDGGVDVLPEVPDDAAELLVEVVHVPVDLLIPHQSNDGTDSVSGGVEVRHRGRCEDADRREQQAHTLVQ